MVGLLSTMVGTIAPVEAGPLSPRRLVEVTDLAAPVISPGGTHVAFRSERASVERNDHESAWYVQRLDGASPPLRVADGGTVLRNSAGEPIPPAIFWAPDGRWIYFLASQEGRTNVWRAAVNGSGASAVTNDAADVRQFRLEANGRWLTYQVSATRDQRRKAERDEYERGIRIDGSIPLGQNLFRSGAIGGRLETQRLGAWFDRVPLLHDVPAQWKSVDLKTGEVHIPRKDNELADRPFENAQVAGHSKPWLTASEPHGKRVAQLTRVGEKAGLLEKPGVELAVYNPKRKEMVTCTAEMCTGQAITGLQWRPDSDEILYTITDPSRGLAQRIFKWNVGSGLVEEVASSKGLLSGGRARSSPCGISKKHLVCVSADPRRPPHLLRIDLETGAKTVLHDPNAALAQDVARGPETRLLRWTTDSGLEFTGQFYPARSKDNKGTPLFITYYLCPGFVRGGVGDEWPLLSLAERGVSALCINAAPYRINAVERYDAGLEAVRSAVRTLAADGIIDPARVGMGGLSFGAEATLWILIHSELLATASLASPGISSQYFLLGSLMGESFLAGLQSYWQLGTPYETPQRWQLLAPDLNLHRLRLPLLMQLPEQEFMHTVDYSIPLVRKGSADIYVFPHEPHQKFQPRHKLAAYERNLDWFLFWLKGEEDPDPAKTEQYENWRTMRKSMGGLNLP